MVRIRIHRNKKVKNIDWDKVIKKSWYWFKVFFVCFNIIIGAYAYGSHLILTNTQKRKYLKSQKMII